jgi:hypothetical protein
MEDIATHVSRFCNAFPTEVIILRIKMETEAPKKHKTMVLEKVLDFAHMIDGRWKWT